MSCPQMNEREYFATDSEELAKKLLQRLRAAGKHGWDLAEVRAMADPPPTSFRYCVFHERNPDEM